MSLREQLGRLRGSGLGGTSAWHLALVGTLTLAAAALRLHEIGASGVWFDEAVTVSLLRLDLGEMLAQIPASESTPPLYYLLAWPWARVFGTGDGFLRSLPAVFGTLTVPVAYAAGARLATRRVGLVLAALVATSPLLIWHSQDGRAYSLLVLLSALSLFFFARALDRRRGRDLAAWAVVSALALTTHYFAVFLIVAEAGWLIAKGERRRVLAAVAVVAVVGAALLPLALEQRAHGGASWFGERALGPRLGDVPVQFAAGYGGAPGTLVGTTSVAPPGLVVPTLVLAAAALLLAPFVAGGPRRAAAREIARSERRGLLLAATLALVAVGAPLLLALAGVDYVLTRNLLPAWLPLGVLAALGLGAARAGRLGMVAALALCGCSAAIVLSTSHAAPGAPESWEQVARRIGVPSGRAIVLPSWASMPLATERRRVETYPARGAAIREIVILKRGDRKPRRFPDEFRVVDRRQVTPTLLMFKLRAKEPRLVPPDALLDRASARRRRTTLLLERPPGSVPPDAPLTVAFCEPYPGAEEARLAIRAGCESVYR